jgi:hypothetical protein
MSAPIGALARGCAGVVRRTEELLDLPDELPTCYGMGTPSRKRVHPSVSRFSAPTTVSCPRESIRLRFVLGGSAVNGATIIVFASREQVHHARSVVAFFQLSTH